MKKILKNTSPPEPKSCNYLKKEYCLMRGDCLVENVLLYYAKISCHNEKYKPKLYKEICETAFKKRYANRNVYLNAAKSKNNTKLSTEQSKLE